MMTPPIPQKRRTKQNKTKQKHRVSITSNNKSKLIIIKTQHKKHKKNHSEYLHFLTQLELKTC